MGALEKLNIRPFDSNQIYAKDDLFSVDLISLVS